MDGLGGGGDRELKSWRRRTSERAWKREREWVGGEPMPGEGRESERERERERDEQAEIHRKGRER